MNNNHKLKAYSLFLVSIIILGLGISLITSAGLGTTAITSPAYVLSLTGLLSFGALTMLVNIIFVLAQFVLLKGKFPKIQYLQLLVGPILGGSIDAWTYLIAIMERTNYVFQLTMVIVGCLVTAISIVLQLKAKVVNNPAEGIVKVISVISNKNFGTVKVLFDLSLVLIALLLSVVTSGAILGIREGTLISAFLVGIIVKKIQQLLDYRRGVFKEKSVSE